MIFIKDINLFSNLVKSKKYKCPFCVKVFNNPDILYTHVSSFHSDELDEEKSVKQNVYDKTHPSEHLCQICKINKCIWNEKTGRYSTICSNPSCREEARRRFKENYKKKNGKDHTLNDPEIQKEMMKNRKTSGNYRFRDGRVLPYISSYEEDFLKIVDLVLGLTVDEIKECPFIFYYEYEDEKHFYLPDYYIEPYDLIIEIKADEDVTHPKILAIDKEKEKLKEEAVKKDGTHNYIKICDKNYDQFIELIEMFKNDPMAQKKTVDKIVIIPERKETIKGFKMPKLNFFASDKTMCNSYIMKKILDEVNGELDISLVVREAVLRAKDMYVKPYNEVVDVKELKTYKCDFKDDNTIKNTFNKFSKYFTKENEHFINQEFLSIQMDLSNLKDWFIFEVNGITQGDQKKVISKIDYFCINNDIQIYSFIKTSTGFILIAKLDKDSKSNSLEKYCVSIMKRSEYSNSSYSKITKPCLPGSYDAGVEVSIIQ